MKIISLKVLTIKIESLLQGYFYPCEIINYSDIIKYSYLKAIYYYTLLPLLAKAHRKFDRSMRFLDCSK